MTSSPCSTSRLAPPFAEIGNRGPTRTTWSARRRHTSSTCRVGRCTCGRRAGPARAARLGDRQRVDRVPTCLALGPSSERWPSAGSAPAPPDGRRAAAPVPVGGSDAGSPPGRTSPATLPLRRPPHHLQVAVACGGYGAFAMLAAHLVDSDQCVVALVGIHTDHDDPNLKLPGSVDTARHRQTPHLAYSFLRRSGLSTR